MCVCVCIYHDWRDEKWRMIVIKNSAKFGNEQNSDV